ncbi:DUF2339 domain-containing protein [Bacillus massiliigorillae]|uniref:DUF2339 domain-containing protein n=1 Tax=Bacillus massiliigorillae TaxID=1243664 RepID=UPI0003A0CB9B|nr:DUF2339 domain-containing protein [Bacillus massiliigorillae]
MKSDELERKIQNIEQTIVTLNEVLVQLKEQKCEAVQVEETKMKQQEVIVKPVHEEQSMPQQSIDVVTQVVQRKEEEKESFDLLRFCQTWLPRIFVGIMMLGVVWLFKAGIDTGLLQPPMRIAFGFILTIILFFVGERQIKAKRHRLGLVLLGGSVAAIVITTFAAHYLYAYIPASIAFILNILWIIGGIYISNRHKSEYLAIFVSVGAFFVPFLINSTEPNVYVFLGYEMLLTFSLLFYAKYKLYKILYVTAYTVAQVVIGTFLIFSPFASLNLELSVVYSIWQIGLYMHFSKEDSYIVNQRLGIFAINGVFLIMLIRGLDQYVTTSLLVASIAFLIMVFISLRKDKKMLVSNVAFALVMLSVASIITREFDGDSQILLLLIQGFIAMYLGYILKNKYKVIIGSVLYIIGAVPTIETPITHLASTIVLAHIILNATLLVIFYKMGKKVLAKSKMRFQLFVYGIMCIVFVTLTKIGYAVTNDWDVNQVIVSFIWMVYASCTIGFGRTTKVHNLFSKNEIIYIGLAVLFITVGKLFFIDLQTVSMTIRAILFLIIGSIGVGISRLFFIKK